MNWEWFPQGAAAGKLPLLLCFAAFIVTFVVTRTITRLIRAGIGPFRDTISAAGVHVHHAVPGIILLIIGAVIGIGSDGVPYAYLAAVLVGTGASLVLDEFALILHLTDNYWSEEGRVSVELVALTVACLGLSATGLTPLVIDTFGASELGWQSGTTTLVVVHFVLIVVIMLKGKYRLALISCFVPLLPFVCAARLARPHSWWARHLYSDRRIRAAARRAAAFDERWHRRWHIVGDLIGGKPTAAN